MLEGERKREDQRCLVVVWSPIEPPCVCMVFLTPFGRLMGGGLVDKTCSCGTKSNLRTAILWLFNSWLLSQAIYVCCWAERVGLIYGTDSGWWCVLVNCETREDALRFGGA